MKIFSSIKIKIINSRERLKHKKPSKFIFTMVVYNFIIDIITLPLFLLSIWIYPDNHEIVDFDLIKIISVIVLAPLIETFLDQMLVILIARKFIKSSTWIIMISALSFSLGHGFDNLLRLIIMFFSGILLAFSYLHWLERSKLLAFCVTCSIHFFHNLIISTPVILYYYLSR